MYGVFIFSRHISLCTSPHKVGLFAALLFVSGCNNGFVKKINDEIKYIGLTNQDERVSLDTYDEVWSRASEYFSKYAFTDRTNSKETGELGGITSEFGSRYAVCRTKDGIHSRHSAMVAKVSKVTDGISVKIIPLYRAVVNDGDKRIYVKCTSTGFFERNALDAIVGKIPRNTKSSKLQPISKLRAAQTELIKRGYDVGAADGVMGPNTISGLKDYQKRNGLEITGKLDDTTARSLGL